MKRSLKYSLFFVLAGCTGSTSYPFPASDDLRMPDLISVEVDSGGRDLPPTIYYCGGGVNDCLRGGQQPKDLVSCCYCIDFTPENHRRCGSDDSLACQTPGRRWFCGINQLCGSMSDKCDTCPSMDVLEIGKAGIGLCAKNGDFPGICCVNGICKNGIDGPSCQL